SALFVTRTTHGSMPCYHVSIKRDCEGSSLYVAFSYRFVTASRSVAAKPAADHVIIRPEALQGLEAPVGRIVVIIHWLAARPVVIDVHSLAAQVQTGGRRGLDDRQVALSVIVHRNKALTPPPSSDCRLRQATPA